MEFVGLVLVVGAYCAYCILSMKEDEMKFLAPTSYNPNCTGCGLTTEVWANDKLCLACWEAVATANNHSLYSNNWR